MAKCKQVLLDWQTPGLAAIAPLGPLPARSFISRCGSMRLVISLALAAFAMGGVVRPAAAPEVRFATHGYVSGYKTFFPDPIMGIRGHNTVLPLPVVG